MTDIEFLTTEDEIENFGEFGKGNSNKLMRNLYAIKKRIEIANYAIKKSIHAANKRYDHVIPNGLKLLCQARAEEQFAELLEEIYLNKEDMNSFNSETSVV
uniref:Uncharacterized protein n=1 Tax=Acrobeloides nanus TaxID=290746 RepID=A0A914C703_9BILA